MHKTQLAEALELYKDTPNEQLLTALTKDKWSAEDIDEIIKARTVAPPAPIKPPDVIDPKKYNPKTPNSNLDLTKFDYNALTGDQWDAYNELVSKLNGFENRDFVQYLASGVFKTALNDNMDKVQVLIGIKINNATPINTSRMPVAAARDLNRQITNKDNPITNSRYWLLKKPE